LRFVGASTAAVLMLLALVLAGSVLAPKAVCEAVNVDGNVYAGYFHIPAKSFARIEFYASKGTNVSIRVLVVDICVCVVVSSSASSSQGRITDTVIPANITSTVRGVADSFSGSLCGCGVDVEIIRPDGSIEYPKSRIYSNLSYNFTAREPGRYIMYLDNTFSDTSKRVLVVVAGFSQPVTVTTTTTVERTATEVRTTTVTYTATSIATTTVTALTTLTVEREEGSMATALSAAALAAAVIAIALALLLRRR